MKKPSQGWQPEGERASESFSENLGSCSGTTEGTPNPEYAAQLTCQHLHPSCWFQL